MEKLNLGGKTRQNTENKQTFGFTGKIEKLHCENKDETFLNVILTL